MSFLGSHCSLLCAGVLLALPCGVFAQNEQSVEEPLDVIVEVPRGDSYLGALMADASENDWKQLFDGESLKGWTPKFVGHEVGTNYLNTFRVVDGLLSVDYSQWGPWDGKFGHLFAEGEYSHYVLRAEYRFVGDQVEGGPGWAKRNNGLMIHGQKPEDMNFDQEFPVSIEFQLLGAAAQGERPNANLCTPGTNVHIEGELVRRHVTNSASPSSRGDEWVTVEVVVNGAEEIRHFLEGIEVMRYQRPELDDKDGEAAARIVAQDGELSLGSGTISIQAESSPAQFRKIEILELDQEDFERAEQAE